MSKLKSQNCNSKIKNIRHRVYYYSLQVVKFVASLPNKSTIWPISDQLIRSGTNIGANVIEAKSSSSKRDFIKFYEIALKSANETKYWLALLRGCEANLKEKTTILINEANEISNILASSLLALKGKKDK